MIAYGGTLGELFENAAYGIAARAGFDADAKPMYVGPVMAIGDTPEELLADWLAQLGNANSERGLSLVSFVGTVSSRVGCREQPPDMCRPDRDRDGFRAALRRLLRQLEASGCGYVSSLIRGIVG